MVTRLKVCKILYVIRDIPVRNRPSVIFHVLSLSSFFPQRWQRARWRSTTAPCTCGSTNGTRWWRLGAQLKVGCKNLWCVCYTNTTLHFTTLHYVLLHYITLHYTTLHHTTLHCTMFFYTTLHCTMFFYTTLHYTTLHCITLHYTILHAQNVHSDHYL